MAAPIGNQNAAKAKRWESALTRALAKVAAGAGVEAGLEKVAEQLVASALAGEQWAIIELGNRMDGKPFQAIGGDSTQDPIQVAARIELVSLND